MVFLLEFIQGKLFRTPPVTTLRLHHLFLGFFLENLLGFLTTDRNFFLEPSKRLKKGFAEMPAAPFAGFVSQLPLCFLLEIFEGFLTGFILGFLQKFLSRIFSKVVAEFLLESLPEFLLNAFPRYRPIFLPGFPLEYFSLFLSNFLLGLWLFLALHSSRFKWSMPSSSRDVGHKEYISFGVYTEDFNAEKPKSKNHQIIASTRFLLQYLRNSCRKSSILFRKEFHE